MNGYSFCIITNFKRPEKLAALVESIEALDMPDYEVIISPDIPKTAKLGLLRNRACTQAQFDHLIVCDDDIVFQDDFYKGLLEYGEDYDVLSCVLLNPDGTRHWDWMTYGGPRGHRLLEYTEPDDGYVYPSGGLVVMKREVWENVKWSDTMGFYEGAAEDVDYGKRLHAEGYKVLFNPHSAAIHDDDRYTQMGNCVMRKEN